MILGVLCLVMSIILFGGFLICLIGFIKGLKNGERDSIPQMLTVIIFIFAVSAFCFWGFYSSLDTHNKTSSNGVREGEDSYGHDWAVAMTVAEKAVKSELKSPSSAEFSPKNETTINVSGNTWTVSGWVEAQNSFGATIRNSYSVKFTFTSSDKYTIEYCNIN